MINFILKTTFYKIQVILDSVYTDPDKFLNGQNLVRIRLSFILDPAEPCKFLNAWQIVQVFVTEFERFRVNGLYW